jgi:hypothetical protein
MLNNLEVKKTLPQVYWNLNFEQKLLDVINKISPVYNSSIFRWPAKLTL